MALVARGEARALTLRAVARRAGVSRTAPYNHFADKQALLSAVAEQGFREMAEAMRRAQAGHDGDPLGRLHALGVAYIDFARAHPAHFRLMFGPEVGDTTAYPALHAATATAFEPLCETVVDCQRVGIMVDGNPRVAAAQLWAATHGVASLLVSGRLNGRGGEDPEAFTNGMMAMTCLGFAPRETLPHAQTFDRQLSGEGDYDT